MSAPPLIALISGVPAAIAPAEEALRRELPDAVLWNIVDDRLISEAVLDGGVTPRLEARMARLIQHAAAEGADAVLLTCSMYAFVTESVEQQVRIPVRGPDDEAFALLAAEAPDAVFVISGVELALRDSTLRAESAFASAGAATRVVPVLAEGARRPSLDRDVELTVERLAAAIESTGEHADAVLLANYSLAFAAEALRDRLALPVVVGPDSAAAALRAQLHGGR